MSGYQTKVYVVQKATRDGVLGEVIAVKLAYGPAHAIAKRFAPATVHFVVADKSESPNLMAPLGDQGGKPLIANTPR